MTEKTCREIVFHFNKKHLEDPEIPMWVLKTGGNTYYVHHVNCQVGWSTKETPTNSHTKGAIKIKNALLKISESNEADVLPLTDEDKTRLSNSKKKNYTRILLMNKKGEIREFIKNSKISHTKFLKIKGGCGTEFEVVDIKTKEGAALLAIRFYGEYRVLPENDRYYRVYDDNSLLNTVDPYYDYDDYHEYSDDDDDE